MITRIEIHNFMAHEHLVLELGPGMTVITGPNNSGKSAIVEALRCMAVNPPAAPFIRHGAKEARVEVTLQDEDGEHSIVWIRVKGHARYELYENSAEEPEVYAKFGSTPPEDILRRLKLNLVGEDLAKGLDVHLGNQRQPVFLLDAPGSTVAQFFAASTESAHLLAMQDLLKAQMSASDKEKRAMEQNMLSLEAGLRRLAPLPGLELGMLDAQDMLRDIRARERELPRLESQVRSIRTTFRDKYRLGQQVSLLRKLLPQPTLASTTPLVRHLGTVTLLSSRHRGFMAQSRVLQGLRTPPELFPTPGLARATRGIFVGRSQAGTFRAILQGLAPLRPAPPLFDCSTLAAASSDLLELRENLAVAGKTVQALRHVLLPPVLAPVLGLRVDISRKMDLTQLLARTFLFAKVYERLRPPPVLEDFTPLSGVIRQLRHLKKLHADMDIRATEHEREMREWNRKANARVKELGVCPTCGAHMTLDQVLSAGHSHG